MSTMLGEIYILEIAICTVLTLIGVRYLFSKEIDKGVCGFTCLCASVVLWGILAYVSCDGVLFNSMTYTFESFANWSLVMFISCSVFLGIKIVNEMKTELSMESITAYVLYITDYYAMVIVGGKAFGNFELNTELMIDINNGIMECYNDIILRTVPILAVIAIVISVASWVYENGKENELPKPLQKMYNSIGGSSK